MGDDWGQDATRREKAALIDTTVPNATRVGDYLYGGRNNFEADRKAVRTLTAAAPVIDSIAPAARAFHQRVVRYLAAEAGIRQFLDIGTSFAAAGNTHEVAQEVAPESRVVYTDNDPMVLAHVRALMKSGPDGVVRALDEDVHDPAAIISGAAQTLDFSLPVAVLLLETLAYVEDTAEAADIVAALMHAAPSGSYLAIYHLASDLDPAMPVVARRWNMMSSQRITLRSAPQLAGLLAGLDPVPPGLVPVTEWHPVPSDPRFEHAVPVHGAVARKP